MSVWFSDRKRESASGCAQDRQVCVADQKGSKERLAVK